MLDVHFLLGAILSQNCPLTPAQSRLAAALLKGKVLLCWMLQPTQKPFQSERSHVVAFSKWTTAHGFVGLWTPLRSTLALVTVEADKKPNKAPVTKCRGLRDRSRSRADVLSAITMRNPLMWSWVRSNLRAWSEFSPVRARTSSRC